jgi:uncharacterized protein (TIGR00251 family)
VAVDISPSVETKDWRTALRVVAGGTIQLDLYVEPNASSQAFGPYDPWRQRIKVKVTAPATGGKANEELSRLIGDLLGVPAKDVRILRGATTRRKTVQVLGVSDGTAEDAIESALGEDVPG